MRLRQKLSDTLRPGSLKATLPKGVRFQKKVLSSGEIVRYGYYGRGAEAIALGREGSAEFHDRIAQILGREPQSGTVFNLIWKYRQSPEFTKRKPRTRADYIKQLDRIQERFGPLSLRAMANNSISNHIYAWRDSRANSPRQADYGIQVLKVLLSWGLKRGLVEHNRAAGVEALYDADRSECIWAQKEIDAFIKVAPETLRRALIFGLETGQRQADLVRLSRGALEKTVIRLTQRKGKVPVTIPISPLLRQGIDQIPPSDATTILTKQSGLPWDEKANGFRSAWRKACAKAGVKGVTFHDLRGTFATRRLAEGWSIPEVAMCTGHSLRDLKSLERYVDRQVVADASAARISKRMSRKVKKSRS